MYGTGVTQSLSLSIARRLSYRKFASIFIYLCIIIMTWKMILFLAMDSQRLLWICAAIRPSIFFFSFSAKSHRDSTLISLEQYHYHWHSIACLHTKLENVLYICFQINACFRGAKLKLCRLFEFKNPIHTHIYENILFIRSIMHGMHIHYINKTVI